LIPEDQGFDTQPKELERELTGSYECVSVVCVGPREDIKKKKKKKALLPTSD
jgi:hypothetical protein